MDFIAKFLATVERIADALEVIAAAKSAGTDAPRTTVKTDVNATKPVADKADTSKADAAKAEKAAAKDKAAKEKAAAKEKEADPMGDPLGGDDEEKKSYTEKDVREILAKVIDKDGRAAAFEILAKQGKGAKAFTDLKPECFEDVYVECQERLG